MYDFEISITGKGHKRLVFEGFNFRRDHELLSGERYLGDVSKVIVKPQLEHTTVLKK